MECYWRQLSLALLLFPSLALSQGVYTKIRAYSTASVLSAIPCRPSDGPLAFVWNDGANNGTWQCTATNTWVQITVGTGAGTVTSVATGAGLTGGPITTTGTISVDSGGITDAMLANGYSGTGNCPSGQQVTGLTRNTAPTCATAAGTITSIGMTVPSFLAVAPASITTSGTFAITAATGQTAHKVLGTGAGASFGSISLTTLDLPFTYSGTTTSLATTTGAFVNGNCVSTDANHNLVDNAAPCGSAGGGTVTSVGFAAPTGFQVTGSPVNASGTLTLAMPSSWTTDDLLAGSGSGVVRLPRGALGTCLGVGAGPALGYIACGGLTSLNGLTATSAPAQTFAVDATTNLFSITSSGSTHTFHSPVVSGTATGTVTPALKAGWDAKGATTTCSANQFVNAIGVSTDTCAAALTASTAPTNQFATAISAAGALTYTQPVMANIAGTAQVSQGGTGATSLAANTLLKGNGSSAISASLATDNGTTLNYPGTITANIYQGNGVGPSTVRMPPVTFTTLNTAVPCTGGSEGSLATVNDSTTTTYGATITGGGIGHVLAYCTGAAWTVH